MAEPSLFCIPLTESCKLMSEWGVYWQAAVAVATIAVGFGGLYKIAQELKRLNEQRKKELEDKESSAQLKRIEFFLGQHRRLFDDKDLYEVLSHIDEDEPALCDPPMWDKKRKLLTFFEEIALLVRAKQISPNVAYYMFGYYATRARDGVNFKVGIDPSPAHWGLFYWFAQEADKYLAGHPDGPHEDESFAP